MEMESSSSRGGKRASKQADGTSKAKAQNSDVDTRYFVRLISQGVQSIMLHSTNEDFRRTNFSKLNVTNAEDAEIVFRNKFLELCGLEPDPFPNDFTYSEDAMEQITPQHILLQSPNSESVAINNNIPENSESMTINNNNNIAENSESLTINNNVPKNSGSVTINNNVPENSESVIINNNILENSQSVTINNNIPENSESHLFVVPVPLEDDNLADIAMEDNFSRSEPTSSTSSRFLQPSMKRCFDDNSFVATKFTKGDMKNILKHKISSLKSLVDTSTMSTTINLTLNEGAQQNEWRT